MRLYLGSKNGIRGEIRPDLSRSIYDFGKGFYMGNMPEQPIGLIAGWKDHTLYEMEFQENGSKVKRSGNQYVLKTKKACSDKHLRIISEQQLTEREKKTALAQSEDKHRQMSGFIGESQTKYRRAKDIKFFQLYGWINKRIIQIPHSRCP